MVVGTAVWRVTIPEEPDPVYGAIAGVVSAVGSLFVFAASTGFVFSLRQVSAGGLGGTVSEFVFITGLVAVFGGIVTNPLVAPLEAFVGYGYEWYLART